MDRYEQRRLKRLQNPEVAAGYREMAAEMELMRLLDEARKEKHLTQEEMAERIGRKREAISRLFSADDVNPTIGTLIELLAALDLTADITLRHTREGEGPMKVVLESSAPYDVYNTIRMFACRLRQRAGEIRTLAENLFWFELDHHYAEP